MSARTLLRALAPLALAALAACDAPTVPARTGVYAFTLQAGSSELVLHWRLGSQIRVAVAPGSSADANLRAALDAGAAAWNAAALYGEYQLVPVSHVADADVVIAGDDAPLPVDISQCMPSAPGFAVTTFCLTTDQRSLTVFPLAPGGGGHVRVLLTVTAAYAANAANAQRVVAHELGHVLGIARHSPDPADLMFASNTVSQPSADDRATVLALYHTPAQVIP